MLRKQLLIIVIFCLTFITYEVKAKENSVYPRGCSTKTVEYQDNNLILGTKPKNEKYRVYVLYNENFAPILVRHITNGQLLDLPLPSIVNPGSWTAVVLEEDNYLLSCQDYSVGYNHSIPCDMAIRACELAVSPIMLSAQGEYWITENNTDLDSLFHNIRQEGIFP